jgi:hypothetical protein
MFAVIHALELLVYLHGRVDMFLKHLGFANFPITRGASFSVPSALQHSNTVNLSQDLFPPVQASPLILRLLSGIKE